MRLQLNIIFNHILSKTSEENPIDLDYKEHSTTFLNYFFKRLLKSSMASSTNQHNWIRWFPCSHDLQRVPPFQVISLSSLFIFFFRFQKTLRHVEFALNPKMVCLFCISHDFGLDMKVFFCQLFHGF